ncbi:MAG TPA: nitric-oxide reductase large subunit, partial [Gammaproteobacteria bacterium]|nr:nitric-oxide reductase large subunit [Gammaproteobacteria bacterium]
MMTYDTLFSIRRLWIILAASMVVMFGTLLYFGGQIYQAAPPIPAAVTTAGGETLFTRADIERGQNVWQSIGGMQQGSIWGHGSYVAPDWSADWLHREAVALLDLLAREDGASSYGALAAPEQARLQAALAQTMRTNTYDAATGVVTVSDERARAIASVALHYSGLF